MICLLARSWCYLGSSWPPKPSRLFQDASRAPSTASKKPPRASKTPPRRRQQPPKDPNSLPEESWGLNLDRQTPSGCCQVLANSRMSQKCLRAMAKHNGLLRRPWPSTKGGLAVVRPRRASSIRQTTLVSHGRVQDRGKEILKDGRNFSLGWAQGEMTARGTAGRNQHLQWPGGLNPLGNSRGISLLGGSWGNLALSWLILASKTPPRPPKTPQDAFRPPNGIDFSRFFEPRWLHFWIFLVLIARFLGGV